MTIRAPEPTRSRADRKEIDRQYRETQLYLLRQCVPGEIHGPAPDDSRTVDMFRVMSAEGYLVEVAPQRYAITVKRIQYRDRLQRPVWRQWLLDNAQRVFPTVVAVASVIVAICAVIIGVG